MPTPTIAIIHPRELIRLGLLSVFQGEAGIKVVAQGSTGNGAQKLVAQRRPRLLLLSDHLDDSDSFDVAKKLIQATPNLKIVMLGVQQSTTYMARAAAARVCDYSFEGSSGRQLLETIGNAANNKPPSPSSDYGKVLASMRERSSHPAVELTPRELQVLRHVGYGLSNEEIARSLAISLDTVKEHVRSILRKMAMRDRTQAAVWAVREGLV